jgi:UDP-glucose 4-epimerase
LCIRADRVLLLSSSSDYALGVGTPSSVLETYAGRRVLLTGASGVIGRALAGVFSGSVAELWVVARPDSAAGASSAHVITADLTLPGAFARVFGSVKPHITFHLASSGGALGEADAGLAERMNHELASEIAEVVAGKGQSRWPGMCLVRAGCAVEYGGLEGVVREDSPGNPSGVFGRSMLAGTWAVSRAIQSSALLAGRATTARLFSVYGPGEPPGRLLASLFEAARTGQRLKLVRGDERRDFTYAGDVVEGLLRLGACQTPAPPVIHLATGQLTTVREFAEIAARELGLRPGQVEFGTPSRQTDDWPRGSADTSQLTRLLGWRPRTGIAEGIRETARLAEINLGTRN